MWKVFGIFREEHKTKSIILFENKNVIWYNICMFSKSIGSGYMPGTIVPKEGVFYE